MIKTIVTRGLLVSGLVLAAAASAPAQAQTLPNDTLDLFTQLCDTNKDGTISKEEIMKRMEKAMKKADPKGTGKLTKEQAREFLEVFTRG
jgi:hypothetical protein